MAYIDKCTYTETYDNGHKYHFTGPCIVTGKPFTVTVDGGDLYKYRQGLRAAYLHVQDAFPYLSADEREFLISGTSPEGWKELFGEEE